MTTDKNPKSFPGRWNLSKEISIGNLISMTGLVIGLFAWGNAIERRLVILEERSIENAQANDRQDLIVRDIKDENRQRLDRIEDKLDAALAAIRAGDRAVQIPPRRN